MFRRAYALLVGTAVVMGLLAIIAALVLDKRLADPDGFLGPSWLRLPLLRDRRAARRPAAADALALARATPGSGAASPRSGSAPTGGASG